MFDVLSRSWPLLLGIMLLMVGNGLQATLLGVRGALEGFSTFEMSLVMSAYFVGFLGGSRIAPELIRRVGHVRVFAALCSLISAVLVLYPTIADPIAWCVLRVLIGFCFSGVYVTAESWLNNTATNETRGQTLSLYLIVQMLGVVVAQALVAFGDPSGFVMFIIPSVLVSISFAPILLSITPTPAFGSTKAMGLRQLYRVSPLGCVGMILMGGVFSGLFGMSAVYGAKAGLSVAQISTFVAAIYLGGLVLQFPIGWISDRMDRRRVIFSAAVLGGVAAGLGVFNAGYSTLLATAFLIGGMSNPLYALLIAHTNDFLEPEDMASASGRLMFINGIGAIAGPVVAGLLMTAVGPPGFFLMMVFLFASLASYAAYRMTQRAAPPADETGSAAALMPTASAVAFSAAQEVYIETSPSEDGNTGATRAAE